MKTQQACARTLLVLGGFILGGCASTDHYREHNPEPNARLDLILDTRINANAQGRDCYDFPTEPGRTVDCQRLQREVDRLYAEYPEEQRVVMANAVLQFEAGRYESAQFLLDQLLAMPGSHPEAAILRARIALAEGNAARARIVLEQQIQLAPDYAELHEALASAYYLDGRYEEAGGALRVASLLGAPGWRLAYHRGLLQEALNRDELACDLYRQALVEKPDFRPAVARLLGLSENAACALMFEGLEPVRSRR